MSLDLSQLTISSVAAALAAGEYTAEELTDAYLARAGELNPSLNAYLEIFNNEARAASRAADAAREAGQVRTPLCGVPLAIKDNILIKGQIVSAASKVLANYHASYDATVISKLRAAGAIFLGRTNLDEFAMGSSTENSAFGPTKNPHNTTRVPGGSSGGSAAAVAASLCLGALGSDTGGSIRQPASFCGVVGLKPTYGAVSRYGLIALASSLDQIGPFAKTVADVELLYHTMAGADPCDATSQDASPVEPAPPTYRIGVPEHFLVEGIASDVIENFRVSLERWREQGHTITTVTLPNISYALACYYIIMPAEASSNLARYDGMRYGSRQAGPNLLAEYEATRGEGFGREVRRRILLGTYVLSSGYYDAYYGKALAVQQLIRRDFDEAFKQVDVIATPTAPTTAFRLGERAQDPLQMYLADVLTVPANIAGLPGISLPSGMSASGLPFGLQLIAPAWREDYLFALGRAFGV